jgi:UDP:flavonoid glycosyltransferase YjiC (YdhE family)
MKTPYTALLSTAGRCSIEPVSGKIFVADYLPGIAAIKKSSVVICSGGSATAYQALLLGIPILGLPSNADQFYTMEAIERNGAGILLRPSLATDEMIGNAVTALVNDPSFSTQAQILARDITNNDTGKQFTDILTTIITSTHED